MLQDTDQIQGGKEEVKIQKSYLQSFHHSDYNTSEFSYIDERNIGRISFGRSSRKTKPTLVTIRKIAHAYLKGTITVGDETLYINSSLNELKHAIDESRILLTYSENWDEEGAEPTDVSTYLKAIKFLIQYAEHIANKGKTLRMPYIDIMKDGSIYLDWNFEEAKFLIIFKKSDNPIAYFYGVSKKGIKLKSGVEIANFENSLAEWMKENLT